MNTWIIFLNCDLTFICFLASLSTKGVFQKVHSPNIHRIGTFQKPQEVELHYFFYLFLVHFGKQDSSKQSLSSMQPPEINKAMQCTNALTVCCDFSYVSGEKSASLTLSTRQKLVPKLSKVWKRMLLFRKSKKRNQSRITWYLTKYNTMCL